MESFSKTFASNGGFVLTHSRAVNEWLRFLASTRIVSNVLSPTQASPVLAALGIDRPPTGAGRRHALAARAVVAVPVHGAAMATRERVNPPP